MASFKDSKGREWNLNLTVGMLKPLRENHKFDGRVMATSMEQLGTVLFSDPENLVGIVYTMCGDQPSKAGVTPEQFGEAMDGSALEAAGEAVVKAVAGFFPRSTVAKSLVERVETVFRDLDKKLMESLPTIGSSDSPTNSAG
jgi:hypothetical protein